jgi:hypothetical protein
MNIEIGSDNWKNRLFIATRKLGDDFWNRFQKVSIKELEKLEYKINRKLTGEFKEFYRIIGYGSFEPGNGFYSPEDIIACLGAPIYFIRGSLVSGSEWATEEEHRKLWRSHGIENPNPRLFTQEKLALDEINLYDLLQFGADGNGCYHQLYVGPEPAPFRYCLLTDSGTMENKSPSFSIALEKMIEQFIFYKNN